MYNIILGLHSIELLKSILLGIPSKEMLRLDVKIEKRQIREEMFFKGRRMCFKGFF